ncbi:MAG: 4Fe-4S dicluster domain-containing protein [Methanomassiliicoccales archaeon]|nr:MAG: 4Fe-4S dicluster domain-containing protein [Methanomassiliicoccales archaeon]
MDDMVLKKEKLSEWSNELSGYKLIAPSKEDDVVIFKETANLNMASLDYANSVKPPKEVFFPQTQELFRFEKTPEVKVSEGKKQTEKVLLFGVRPCDARSLLILDKLFYWDSEDPFYRQARDNTVIVGLACTSPHHNCYCTSVGGKPYSNEGLDVLMTDLGDRFFVEVITKKGEEVIRRPNELFLTATSEDKTLRDEIWEKAESEITKHVDVEGVHDKLGELFDSQYWEKKAQTCVGCGICSFLCPTCHCFDITDEDCGTCGRRIRTWDTCMIPEYTVHASGYNPRPGKKNRLKNRVFHKFRYFPDRFDVIACVGCGRCISKCPVGIDIVETLKEVKEQEEVKD